MLKQERKTSYKNIFIVLLGSAITAFGILCFLAAEKGVDPISTFLLGMMEHLPFAFGTCSQVFNIVVLSILVLVDRKKIGLGSVLNAITVGFFINIFQSIGVDEILIAPTWFLAVIGPIILGVGTGIYLAANIGAGALEGIMLYLAERTKLSIKSVRIILDATLVIAGFFLGGMVGVGTIIGILIIGPTIEGTLKGIAYFQDNRR